MKKFLAMLISISLLLTVCVPAFAGESVDALTDEQQKQIATLVLDAIDAGNSVSTTTGRNQIKNSVINGLDLDELTQAYNDSPETVNNNVIAAIEAVKSDLSFSDDIAKTLEADINLGIKKKVAPEEDTTTPPAGDDGESGTNEEIRDSIDAVIQVVSNLPYDQAKDVIVTLLGNGVINKTEAEYIAKQLMSSGKITADQYQDLIATLNSDEANKTILDKIFEGYTPADLSQLFRGFGDALSTIATAIANLLRDGSSDDPSNNGGNNNKNTDAPDIPATGDYTLTAVTTVALLAGAAFVLTRKKKDEE